MNYQCTIVFQHLPNSSGIFLWKYFVTVVLTTLCVAGVLSYVILVHICIHTFEWKETLRRKQPLYNPLRKSSAFVYTYFIPNFYVNSKHDICLCTWHFREISGIMYETDMTWTFSQPYQSNPPWHDQIHVAMWFSWQCHPLFYQLLY